MAGERGGAAGRTAPTLAAGTGGSVVVRRCQVCDDPGLEPVLFLGYLPPVNQMPSIGEPPAEQAAYPAQLLRCPRCTLVQLGLVVDPAILFPPEYPYTSGTTRILRENFADLYREARTLVELGPQDLVVDIGSNDGTLLANFVAGGHRVQGIEPSQVGHLANQRKIPTLISFFGPEVARRVRAEQGPARIVTATNVFAHMEDVHAIVESIVAMLDERGVFISESHYLHALIDTLQYDTIYHEHLRHYSVTSLQRLLEAHGLAVVHVTRIPTHGGSIRVYAARPGAVAVRDSVRTILDEEAKAGLDPGRLRAFRDRVVLSKLKLQALLLGVRQRGQRVYGVGAPSRASTLINYVGIDEGVLECVLEVKGSHKIGKYVPGTLIPVVDEARLAEDPPDFLLLLSWHIADELMPKLRQQGFRGGFIVPLPEPRVIGGEAS